MDDCLILLMTFALALCGEAPLEQAALGPDPKPSDFGYSFEVAGEKGAMIVKRSANVTLNCYIKGQDYDGLQHTIRWIKVIEGKQIPISANTIVDTLLSKNKFRITAMRDLPSYYLDLQLKIFNVGLNDNGSYVCEVLGVGGHHILGRHSVDLLVREQVRTLQLFYTRNGTNMTSRLDTSLRLELEQPSDVTCQASGGNPPPRLKVFLGQNEITDRFIQRRMSVTYTGTPPWEQHFIYTNQITCPDCKFVRGDHNQLLQCESTVEGFDNIVTTSKQLVVYFKPDITCQDKFTAAYGATNFHILCKIQANPGPEHVQWLVGEDTMLVEGHVDGNYSVIGDQVPPTLRTSTLVIAEVTREHFDMKFVVMAKNRYGAASKTLILVPGATVDRQQADSYVEGDPKAPAQSTVKPKISAVGHATGYNQGAASLSCSLPITRLILFIISIVWCSR